MLTAVQRASAAKLSYFDGENVPNCGKAKAFFMNYEVNIL
jgi:hypothetical protein